MLNYVFTVSAFSDTQPTAQSLILRVCAENEVEALNIVEDWCDDNGYKLNLFATTMYRVIDDVQYSAKAVRRFEEAEAAKTARAWFWTKAIGASLAVVVAFAAVATYKGYVVW